MFVCVPRKEFPYEDPWLTPAEERLAVLSRGTRRILYFYNRPDTSTFRYRVFNMTESINYCFRRNIAASWFSKNDYKYIDSFLDRADVLVICRALYDAQISYLVCRAKARGLRVIYDVDDFIFNPDYAHLIMETLGQVTDGEGSWDHWFGRISRYGATLRLCDSAIATNSLLAARLKDYVPHLTTHVVPNYLNHQQQILSETMWEAKREAGFLRDERVHIGYFSGTPTHERDFEIVFSALADLLDNDRDVTLRVVGFLDSATALSRYRDRIEVFPLQDFMNLQRLIAEVEINIAPLQNNDFTNCKSELKYFEASIVGTLTIASPTFTFRSAIRDGENGFLATAAEWHSKLRLAVEVARDQRRYSRMAERTFSEVQTNYAWDRYADQIASAVF